MTSRRGSRDVEEQTFREKWLDTERKKDSVVCVNLNAVPVRRAGRCANGGPTQRMNFIEAFSPYCSAIRANIRNLSMYARAHELGMVVIGNTLEDGYVADAVIYSPLSGDLETAVRAEHSRGIGVLSTVVKSNPKGKGFQREWAPVELAPYHDFEIEKLDGVPHARYHVKLAQEAFAAGADGIVIGAPQTRNHFTSTEIQRIRSHAGVRGLVFVPDTEGRDLSTIWSYFDSHQVIVELGKSLVFEGTEVTPDAYAAQVKIYRDMFNELQKGHKAI